MNKIKRCWLRVVFLTRSERAQHVIRNDCIALSAWLAVFMVVGLSEPRVIKLYSTESFSCPTRSNCYHVFVAWWNRICDQCNRTTEPPVRFSTGQKTKHVNWKQCDRPTSVVSGIAPCVLDCWSLFQRHSLVTLLTSDIILLRTRNL